ncbi:hypothetical protein DQ384_36045 [Sphaerisporangium album]|uniref:RNA polymerase sigma-70 region 2 domain-containing protein n=1 Tax=Sphaerisporangium album TaxID=509200 RepID=A0A367EW17_9ACTN|nr:sigma factor [Sphaerisporangium album]RCG21889.1 hypothetical protein DQ384_36045 [Sphaerisporangium album]
MTDELLVVRAQLGERTELAELVARWRVPLWTYVRRMLDAERADDVSQEIWPAVIRGLPGLRAPGRFTPWLFTIARRSVTDRLRTEYARAAEIAPDTFLTEDHERIGPALRAARGGRVHQGSSGAGHRLGAFGSMEGARR